MVSKFSLWTTGPIAAVPNWDGEIVTTEGAAHLMGGRRKRRCGDKLQPSVHTVSTVTSSSVPLPSTSFGHTAVILPIEEIPWLSCLWIAPPTGGRLKHSSLIFSLLDVPGWICLLINNLRRAWMGPVEHWWRLAQGVTCLWFLQARKGWRMLEWLEERVRSDHGEFSR